MTTRIEKERTKQIQDKCQNLLNQMLRDEDNKYCVDCDAKGSETLEFSKIFYEKRKHRFFAMKNRLFSQFLLILSTQRPNFLAQGFRIIY